MGNYNVGNETKNGSRCVCKWKGVVCLAGILISLVVGSFCVVTYGASAGEADGSESEQVDTSGNPTSDVEDGLTGTTGGYAEQEDGYLRKFPNRSGLSDQRLELLKGNAKFHP